MASRLILHQKLKEFISNVYFQPPSGNEMRYPCIRYTLTQPDVKHANNKKYMRTQCYELTIIDDDPDSLLPSLIEDLPLSKFTRFYPADDLNHWVYTLYF